MLSPLMARAALLATLAACTTALAATNVYRWVDQAGKVHFSDTPPPEEAKSVSQKRLGGGYTEQSQLPYATQIAAKRNPVTLYTASDCGTPCERGRDLLAQRGIPFSERNAQSNPADAEALKKLSGSPEVPFLVIGESKLKGYDEDSWQAALDAGGYPRTRLPGQPASAAPPEKAPARAAPGSAAVPPR
jgi:glutaredoxin